MFSTSERKIDSTTKSALKEGQKSVALLDVDETLIIGNSNIDPDNATIEAYEEAMQQPGVLNTDLINALCVTGIQHAYFFTDMTMGKTSVMERQALINILRDKYKITVDGVITPADCTYHLPHNELKQMFEDATFVSDYNKLPIEDKNNIKNSVNSFKEKYKDKYPCLINNKNKETFLCKVFSDAVSVLNDNEKIQQIYDCSVHAKSFSTKLSILEEKGHVKSKMYELFLQHNTEYNKCFIFDDRKDVLSSITETYNSNKKIHTELVYVNNYGKKKNKNEKIQDENSYIDIIGLGKHPKKLINACNDYLVHLNESSDKDINDSYTRKKIDAVEGMRNSISIDKSDQGLADFTMLFKNNASLLQTRRDSAGMIFLKVIATICSFGIAACCGLWAVKGKQVTQEISDILPQDLQSHSEKTPLIKL